MLCCWVSRPMLVWECWRQQSRIIAPTDMLPRPSSFWKSTFKEQIYCSNFWKCQKRSENKCEKNKAPKINKATKKANSNQSSAIIVFCMFFFRFFWGCIYFAYSQFFLNFCCVPNRICVSFFVCMCSSFCFFNCVLLQLKNMPVYRLQELTCIAGYISQQSNAYNDVAMGERERERNMSSWMASDNIWIWVKIEYPNYWTVITKNRLNHLWPPRSLILTVWGWRATALGRLAPGRNWVHRGNVCRDDLPAVRRWPERAPQPKYGNLFEVNRAWFLVLPWRCGCELGTCFWCTFAYIYMLDIEMLDIELLDHYN